MCINHQSLSLLYLLILYYLLFFPATGLQHLRTATPDAPSPQRPDSGRPCRLPLRCRGTVWAAPIFSPGERIARTLHTYWWAGFFLYFHEVWNFSILYIFSILWNFSMLWNNSTILLLLFLMYVHYNFSIQVHYDKKESTKILANRDIYFHNISWSISRFLILIS